jgi:hypothetical protein
MLGRKAEFAVNNMHPHELPRNCRNTLEITLPIKLRVDFIERRVLGSLLPISVPDYICAGYLIHITVEHDSHNFEKQKASDNYSCPNLGPSNGEHDIPHNNYRKGLCITNANCEMQRYNVCHPTQPVAYEALVIIS